MMMYTYNTMYDPTDNKMIATTLERFNEILEENPTIDTIKEYFEHMYSPDFLEDLESLKYCINPTSKCKSEKFKKECMVKMFTHLEHYDANSSINKRLSRDFVFLRFVLINKKEHEKLNDVHLENDFITGRARALFGENDYKHIDPNNIYVCIAKDDNVYILLRDINNVWWVKEFNDLLSVHELINQGYLYPLKG